MSASVHSFLIKSFNEKDDEKEISHHNTKWTCFYEFLFEIFENNNERLKWVEFNERIIEMTLTIMNGELDWQHVDTAMKKLQESRKNRNKTSKILGMELIKE